MADILDSAAVAEALGFATGTVTKYLSESRPGNRYESHPFPSPDGYVGQNPYWVHDRVAELEEWARNRPGRGAGGGRPRKVAVE
jgi:hypothetical protein